MNRKIKNISITTGDVDGIGLEVSIKALQKLGPQKGFCFLLNRSADAKALELKKLDKKFSRVVVSNLNDAVDFLSQEKISTKILMDIASPLAPPFWVQESAQLCMKNSLHGIVTAPMSKSLIYASGLKDMGHTDILQRVSRAKQVRMGFIGDHFNVVLATGHLPLREVSTALTFELLKASVIQAYEMTKSLGWQKKPLALLGLNPHAGEKGLIGEEENGVFKAVFRWADQAGIPLKGPLVPDAAFLKSNWKKYSCFITPYHDQGLIPFKMIHGQDSGCHLSLGLPFIRTSVDHGTAKDIFGQNKANPLSMTSALEFCMKLNKEAAHGRLQNKEVAARRL